MTHPLKAFVRPDSYVPLTERLIAAVGAPRWAVAAVFATLPFVHLIAVSWVNLPAGAAQDEVAWLLERVPTRLVNVYLTFVGFWGAAWLAGQLSSVQSLPLTARGPRATWLTWLLPPLVLDLLLALANEGTRIAQAGYDAVAAQPAPFILSFVLALLIRLPQMAAFWTAVVALLAVAKLGVGTLPARFPEDRALGLSPIGRLVLGTFLLYTAAFVPVFAVGQFGLVDLLTTVGVFLAGIAAMVLAVWRVHTQMALERARMVASAQSAYAAAYRAVAAELGGTKRSADSSRLSAAESLLRGAESIHEWPFDERMQRIAAVVMTGVATGIVVRLILFGLGI